MVKNLKQTINNEMKVSNILTWQFSFKEYAINIKHHNHSHSSKLVGTCDTEPGLVRLQSSSLLNKTSRIEFTLLLKYIPRAQRAIIFWGCTALYLIQSQSGYRVSFLESTKIGKNTVPLNSKLAKNEIDKICLLFKDDFNIQN